jgi:hypothetical protein
MEKNDLISTTFMGYRQTSTIEQGCYVMCQPTNVGQPHPYNEFRQKAGVLILSFVIVDEIVANSRTQGRHKPR